jgi:hypothetical protein
VYQQILGRAAMASANLACGLVGWCEGNQKHRVEQSNPKPVSFFPDGAVMHLNYMAPNASLLIVKIRQIHWHITY